LEKIKNVCQNFQVINSSNLSEGDQANELSKINQQTKKEVKNLSEVYCFQARAINNKPTANKHVFSEEFQKSLDWNGKSIGYEHERDVRTVAAKIYDHKVENGETLVKAYIPNTDNNKETIEAIDYGMLKSMSVGVSVSEETYKKERDENGNLVLSAEDGKTAVADELSFVFKPASKDAAVLKNSEDNSDIIRIDEDLKQCVSNKVKKLMFEGKDQKQAVAIAYSMCREGKHSLSTHDQKILELGQRCFADKIKNLVRLKEKQTGPFKIEERETLKNRYLESADPDVVIELLQSLEKQDKKGSQKSVVADTDGASATKKRKPFYPIRDFNKEKTE